MNTDFDNSPCAATIDRNRELVEQFDWHWQHHLRLLRDLHRASRS